MLSSLIAFGLLPFVAVVLYMGACTTPGHMAIVTELMPNGNVAQVLHNPKVEVSLKRRYTAHSLRIPCFMLMRAQHEYGTRRCPRYDMAPREQSLHPAPRFETIKSVG